MKKFFKSVFVDNIGITLLSLATAVVLFLLTTMLN